eukprot:m.160069 g.160069  ORF g.160069 m.160069 type:complete len:1577 (-) comp15166_c0_seq2:5-4735(-)
MGGWNSVRKAVQRQIIDWTTSRTGLTVCFAGIFLSLIAGLRYGQSAIEWSRIQYESRFSEFSDNLRRESFQARMCSPLPVDIVYTWVNGSDPQMLADLASLKLQLEMDYNMSVEANRTQANLERLNATMEANVTAEFNMTNTNFTNTPRNLSVAENMIRDRQTLSLQGLQNTTLLRGLKEDALRWRITSQCGNVTDISMDYLEVAGLVTFQRLEDAEECLSKSIPLPGANITMLPSYVVPNMSLDGLLYLDDVLGIEDAAGFAVPLHRTVLITGIPRNMSRSSIKALLSPYGRVQRVTLDPAEESDEIKLLVEFTQRMSLIDILDKEFVAMKPTNETSNNGMVKYVVVEESYTTTQTTQILEHNNSKNDTDLTDENEIRDLSFDDEYKKMDADQFFYGGDDFLDFSMDENVDFAQQRRRLRVDQHKEDLQTDNLDSKFVPELGKPNIVNVDLGNKQQKIPLQATGKTRRSLLMNNNNAEDLNGNNTKNETTITNQTTSTSTTFTTTSTTTRNNVVWLRFHSVVRIGQTLGLDSEVVKNSERLSNRDKHSEDEEEPLEKDEISASRFQDNSELQYSLRSIEKFAPWVRQIFIVTNGQIPSWLNLDHPRLTVVTHEDIFENKSHLPVFSSPAIEANIHRIPGLSENFIYLNDDVMFGTPIWPDDFYTHGKGHKVYLAWPVPNCVEACPSNWLGDKYCDQACNNAECEWDGGDCLKDENKAIHEAGINTDYTPMRDIQCIDGCADNWLGDKFCDKACKHPQCGMDAGDCGTDSLVGSVPYVYVYEGMPAIDLMGVQENFTDGEPVPALWLNLTAVFGNQNTTSIADGVYERPDLLISAVVNQKEHSLVLVFKPGINHTVVNIALSTDEINSTTIFLPESEEDIVKPPLANRTNSSNITYSTASTATTTTSTNNITVTTTTTIPKIEHLPNVSMTVVNRSITLRLSILVDTSWVYVEKSTTSAPLTEQLMDNNQTNSSFLGNMSFANGTNTSMSELGSFKFVDGDAFNYWELNATTEAPVTTPKKSHHVSPPVINDISLLPENIQIRMKEIKEEFSAGDLTQKGYDKYMHNLLLPFKHLAKTINSSDTNRNMTNQTKLEPFYGNNTGGNNKSEAIQGSNTRRRLLALPSPSLKENVQMLEPGQVPLLTPAGNLDQRTRVYYENGHTLTWKQLYVRDWIQNQKQKQLNKDRDLKKAVKKWEDRLGMKWLDDYVPNVRRSSFPWERLGIFDHLLKPPTRPSEHRELAMKVPWRSRKLKDTFGDSLKKVNKLYNQEFGFEARKAIAHMPHMININIMNDLVDRFPEEWKHTSSNRLRSGDDMQYAFAYFYYLMSVQNKFDPVKEFNLFDADGNGLLSVHELRVLVTRIYELPTSVEQWVQFEDILLNCSHLQEPMEELGVGVGSDAKEVWVTAKLFSGCDELLKLVNASISKESRLRYKHQLESDEVDIAFKMIRNNISKVSNQLDQIRRDPKKFICLNDNLDHRKKSAEPVVDALHNFYQSMFPVRSQFELDVGSRNRFLHVSELREWRKHQQKILWWSKVAMFLIVCFMMASMFSGKLKKYRRSIVQVRLGSCLDTSLIFI